MTACCPLVRYKPRHSRVRTCPGCPCSRVSHGGGYNTSHIAVPVNGLYPGGCAMAAVPGSMSPLSSGTSDCLLSAVSFCMSSSPKVRLQQENRGDLSPFYPLPTSRFFVSLSCGPSGLCCLSCHYQDRQHRMHFQGCLPPPAHLYHSKSTPGSPHPSLTSSVPSRHRKHLVPCSGVFTMCPTGLPPTGT